MILLNIFFIFFQPSLNYRDFQYVQSMLFAVEEINNSSTLLPGVSLGYKIYDTCGSMAMAVRVTMALANGHENTSSAGPCTKQAYVQTILGDTNLISMHGNGKNYWTIQTSNGINYSFEN